MKTEKAYVIVGPSGWPLMYTIRGLRRPCVSALVDNLKQSWPVLRKKGYAVVKVRVEVERRSEKRNGEGV